MTKKEKNLISSSSSFSLAVLASRMLGFVRDMLYAFFLGAGLVMSAWILAFTAANFLRRLFGEGALGQALIPLMSHSITEQGREAARKKAGAVLIVLSIFLFAFSLVAGAASFFLSGFAEKPDLKLALSLFPFLAPFILLICLVGMFTALLNAVRHFFLPALSSVILNVCLITSLLWAGRVYSDEPLLRILAAAVVVSGILQLSMLGIILYRENFFPSLNPGKVFAHPAVSELWRLTLPGIVGASALQFSLLVDKWVACIIGPHAVASLYYSDRLVYLPVGLFAVGMGTVLLQRLSYASAERDAPGFAQELLFGVRQILFIAVPASVFIWLFREPVLRLLFFRGDFGASALRETSYALSFYAFGIPAFMSLKILVGGFHARKMMKLPVKISICCVALNIALNFALMVPFRQGGIALATVVSSFVNIFALSYFLRREVSGARPCLVLLSFSRQVFSAVPAGFVSLYVSGYVSGLLPEGLFLQAAALAAAVISFSLVYLAVVSLAGGREFREWCSALF